MPPETHDSSVGLFPRSAVGELPSASGIPWLSARIEIQSNPIHTGLRWWLTVCPTHLFTHPKSRLMFCTSFIERIGLIPDLIAIWLFTAARCSLCIVYGCWRVAVTMVRGVTAELPRHTQEASACSFPSLWRTSVCIEEASRKKTACQEC